MKSNIRAKIDCIISANIPMPTGTYVKLQHDEFTGRTIQYGMVPVQNITEPL